MKMVYKKKVNSDNMNRKKKMLKKRVKLNRTLKITIKPIFIVGIETAAGNTFDHKNDNENTDKYEHEHEQ